MSSTTSNNSDNSISPHPEHDESLASTEPTTTWVQRHAVITAILVAIATMIVGAFGVNARSTRGAQTSSDEPQYLITALSLAEDGDLDISDELDAEAFRPFHEIKLNAQTYDLNEEGQRLSPHDPLLPLLSAPAMKLWGWQGVRSFLVLIGGLVAGITTWTALRRRLISTTSGVVAVAAIMMGAPVAAYSTQVFPEIMAALAVIVAVAAGTSPKLRWFHLILAGLAIVALPWLSVKYAPVAATITAVIAWRLWRDDRRRDLVISILALGLAGVVYLLVHQRIYGGWTVYATGDHFADYGEFTVVGRAPNMWGRSRRLIGLLADRQFGLIPWAPIWFFTPAALVWWIRRHISSSTMKIVVIATITVGWLMATFVAFTMHGWWSPGRQIVVITPLVALALAKLVDDRRWLTGPAIVLGLAGAINWIWLGIEASTGHRTIIVDFHETAAVPYRAIARFFALGSPRDAANDPILAVWSIIVIITMVIAWRRSPIKPVADADTPAEELLT